MIPRWIENLESADPGVRSLALQKLQELGPQAREAVPALIAALEEVRDDANLRSGLVATLGAIGPDARAAVPLLVSLMDPWSAYLYDLGVPEVAILHIGGEPAAERRALTNLLRWRHPRWTFADHEARDAEIARQYPLDRIGPRLVEMLSDGNSDPALLLAMYGTAAIPLLLPPLRQHIGPAQSRYVHALQAIGESAIPALRQELQGTSAAGRRGAARALGGFEARAEGAFEDLAAVLDDAEAEARYTAAVALVRIAPSRAIAAIPHLVAGLASADAGTRGEAVDMLALLARAGRPADEALPALNELLADPELHRAAGLALVAIHARRPAEEALPELNRLLADPEARQAAALTLVELDAGRAATAVPVLVEVLEQTDLREISYTGPAPAVAILTALGRIGPPAAAAAPLIRAALASPNMATRARAAVALARVVPARQLDAVNTLLPLLDDRDDFDSFWEGVDGLAAIGPAARQAIPRLEDWLFDAQEKRATSGAICSGPGEPAAQMFSALLRIDPTAPARVLARLEADLQSPERFDQAAQLLLDIAGEIPGSAPLLVNLLEDRRAEARWDAIRSALGRGMEH
jgi:hypothetical protein